MERRTEWRGSSLETLLSTRLSSGVGEWVERVARLGKSRGDRVYLVGGLVRDLLLGVPHRDLDVMVEGDGGRFADALAAEVGGKARKHAEFLTALVTAPDGFEIDVVTARAERYPSPAALPRVEPGDLASDLLRRDFAVNALALQIAPGPELSLVDLVGGIADLEGRSLRVLHDGSFRDDPTRLLRGVRLETRLGFRLAPETERLGREAIAEGIFDRLSGSRLRHELVLLLEEPEGALPGLERLADLGALAAFHSRLRWSPDVAAALASAEAQLATPLAAALAGPDPARLLRRWRYLWMVLALEVCGASEASEANLDAEVESLGRRLLLEGPDAEVLIGFPRRLARARAALAAMGSRARVPHVVAEALEPLSGEDLLLLARDESLRAAVELYQAKLRELRPGLRGADLVAAGEPPGPAIGEALRAVRRALWDGEVGAEGELRFALAHLARLRAASEAVNDEPAFAGAASLGGEP